jgi:hypothetical protein
MRDPAKDWQIYHPRPVRSPRPAAEAGIWDDCDGLTAETGASGTMGADWLERVRRTTPWRVWVRGTQACVAGAMLVGLGGVLVALGAPPVVVIAGFGVAVAGVAAGFAGMTLLLARNYQQFTGAGTSVSRALARDLVRLGAPPPFIEPPWPPPQWRAPVVRTDQERDG